MSTFWAAGKDKVASADSPTPTITEAPPKMSAASQQKKGLFLKGVANGHAKQSAATNGKMRDWADDDEDESFLTTFTKTPDPRIATLEKTVALKAERVKELEATVVTKTLLIEELETTVQDKDHQIGELKAEVEEKDAQIEAHMIDNEKQFLNIQELHGEIDSKDSRIKELEAEVLKKDHAIRQLELLSGSDSPVSPDDTEITSEEDVTPSTSADAKTESDAAAKKEPAAEKVTSQTSSSSSDFEIVDTPKSLKVEEPVTEQAKEEPPAARGPSFGEFPTFVTKETLKVVPPPPAPKIMKFPMDMSRFGKKAVASTTPKRPSSPGAGKTLNGHTSPWGAASKQARVKTNTMPKFTPHKDIRHMPHGERVVFANGPDVIVKLGEVKLATIPKYILMQCSDLALKYFESKPEATTWVFPAGTMDAEAVKAHLAWMDEMTYQGRVYSITLNTSPEHDHKNLQICRAARVMGLNNTYVGHFTKQLCNRIREGTASSEFMDMVCELAYPKNDPIFECLANNLVNQKKLNQLQDEAVFDKLVAKHGNLKQKIVQIEDKMAGRRGKKSPDGSQRGASASGDRKGGNSGNGGKASGGGRPAPPAGGGASFGTTR
jgi:hypothetical protein